MMKAKWNLQNFPYHNSRRIIYVTFFTTKRALFNEGKKKKEKNKQQTNTGVQKIFPEDIKKRLQFKLSQLCMRSIEGCIESNAMYLIMLTYDVRGRCWWHGHKG